mmetsp:Transcript_82958/g.253532  ORF Transcript_82958/g.253532 Transcript_82958/m.253532 type:complete len:158 (-) Transcript_82958:90-563(-)
MGGQSEKKQAKKAEQTRTIFLYALLGVNALYILWRVVFHWASWGKWHMVGFAFLSFVSYFTFSGINTALEIGMDYEMYLDVFAVNLGTQLLATFSNYGWLLYLVVPGYLGWKVAGMVKDYVFTPTAEEAAENDAATQKRLAKKQRQAERPKVKFSKR